MNREKYGWKQTAYLCGYLLGLFILLSAVVIAYAQNQSTSGKNSPAVVSNGNVSLASPSSTASPATKPATSSPPTPPSPPAYHPLTPDQVELWLETINAENRAWSEYLQATRVREGVLQQIQRDLKCPGCVMVKQPNPKDPNPTAPGKVSRAVYMLTPAQ